MYPVRIQSWLLKLRGSLAKNLIWIAVQYFEVSDNIAFKPLIRLEYRALLALIGLGTEFIVLGMVFDPKHGFTGQDSALEFPDWWGFVITCQGDIDIRLSQYPQFCDNMAFMLPRIDAPYVNLNIAVWSQSGFDRGLTSSYSRAG